MLCRRLAILRSVVKYFGYHGNSIRWEKTSRREIIWICVLELYAVWESMGGVRSRSVFTHTPVCICMMRLVFGEAERILATYNAAYSSFCPRMHSVHTCIFSYIGKCLHDGNIPSL